MEISHSITEDNYLLDNDIDAQIKRIWQYD